MSNSSTTRSALAGTKVFRQGITNPLVAPLVELLIKAWSGWGKVVLIQEKDCAAQVLSGFSTPEPEVQEPPNKAIVTASPEEIASKFGYMTCIVSCKEFKHDMPSVHTKTMLGLSSNDHDIWPLDRDDTISIHGFLDTAGHLLVHCCSSTLLMKQKALSQDSVCTKAT